VIADESKYKELQELLSGTNTKVAAGAEALIEAAQLKVDYVMAAITGIAGLPSVFAAAKTQKNLAIANKESIVCGGALLMAAAKKNNCSILPVDSEHHALSRLLKLTQKVERIILTASGGAFRDLPLEQMKNITPEQAIAHPVWSMGDKISIDSATMMNKVLELIEAHYLFALPPEKLTMIQHRESIVHGLVEETGGGMLAFMGAPDMRLAIADILNETHSGVEHLDLAKLAQLSFEPIDPERFPASRLALPVLEAGQGAAIVLNAANEVLVKAFLQKTLPFNAIAITAENVLETMIGKSIEIKAITDVIALDQLARETTEERMRTL
jgi:1-deoxy-D-xylulose-5-phosphate reductoisomerase